MLAPRIEVDDLNARARFRMARAGRLSGPELVVDERPFQAGDRVLTLRNDRRVGVLNGTRGKVAEVDTERRELTVATDAGPTVTLPTRYLDAGHVAHGYAVTAHKAQGATVDRAMLLGTDAVYRELGYVGMSRGRFANTLYVVGRPEDADDLHRGAAVTEAPDDLVFRALTTSRSTSVAVDSDRPDAGARLRALYVERTRLQVVLVREPPNPFRDRLALTEARERAVTRLTDAEARVAACRPSRLRSKSTAEQAWAEAGMAQARDDLERVDAELAAVARREVEWRAWLDAHADELARVNVLKAELSDVLAERVAEVQRSCPRYIEDTLGPPPANEVARGRWRRGVRTIESYRVATSVTDQHHPLGPRRDAEWPAAWDQASRAVAETKTGMAQALDPTTGIAAGRDVSVDIGL